MKTATTAFLSHQEIFDRAAIHLQQQGRAGLLQRGGGAYCGYLGGCPVGRLIRPRDYSTTMEGVPVRFLARASNEIPAYMDAGVAALKKALLRAHINVYDSTTIALLSCLQNVHDVFGTSEWQERLICIARQFGLSAERVTSTVWTISSPQRNPHLHHRASGAGHRTLRRSDASGAPVRLCRYSNVPAGCELQPFYSGLSKTLVIWTDKSAP
jgi:hypothetical protein